MMNEEQIRELQKECYKEANKAYALMVEASTPIAKSINKTIWEMSNAEVEIINKILKEV